MKPIRGFLLSTAFIGLAFLAFNPHAVVKIQNIFSSDDKSPSTEIETSSIPTAERSSEKILETDVRKAEIAENRKAEVKFIEPKIIRPSVPEISRPQPPKLPVTVTPDKDNLPVIENFDKIPKDDDWVGDTPCKEDIFDIPMNLPTLSQRIDGPLFTDTLKATEIQNITNQPSYIFKSEHGVTLKVIRPVFDYYNLSGRTYKEAKDDLFQNKPLEVLRQIQPKPDVIGLEDSGQKKTKTARAADIFGPISLRSSIGGLKDRFEIYPKQTELTIGFLITLPKWKNYDFATTEDQLKWDDFICNTSHHELGHLRIRLDLIAETLNGYAALSPAQSQDEMRDILYDYRAKISAIINARQAVYHIYNGGGIRRGMGERPYAELPFPWLEKEQTSP